MLANVRASAPPPFPAYQIPLKDAFKRSTWPTPAQLTYADEPNGFWFAAADECAPGIWSPGGHGRRFGVMLERALAALGVKPQTLEAALNRKANARKKTDRDFKTDRWRPAAATQHHAGGRTGAPELATFVYSYGPMVLSEGLITVEDAAKRLGVSKKRVYGLAAAGALSPHPIGANRYLLDAAEVEARRAQGVVNGRPLDQLSAWAVLWLGLGRGDHDLGPWGAYLARNTRWRVRQRLGAGPVSDSLAALAPRLRNRAESVKLRAHPSDLRRLLDEPSLVRTGVSAAADVGADVVAADEVEAYVPADDLAPLREKFFLEESRKPNVLLRVVQPPWPFPPDTHVAPATAVAVDLLDSTDERTRRAGRELLQSLDRDRVDD